MQTIRRLKLILFLISIFSVYSATCFAGQFNLSVGDNITLGDSTITCGQTPYPSSCSQFGSNVYCGYNCSQIGSYVYCGPNPGTSCAEIGSSVYCTQTASQSCSRIGSSVYCGVNCKIIGAYVYCSDGPARPATPANPSNPSQP
jgi:serine acetyltransferase